MAGLVLEEEHPGGSTNSSSQESGPEQRFLRNAPPALLGIGVIKPIRAKATRFMRMNKMVTEIVPFR